ncbi:MAG: hypothetical protein A3J93_01970 [Candidatus Magasanikbacteria bacterium RIFOXYC2_FULL_42_28]|uniref:UvrD-like helicase ATP-binding domain-containing protein n=1 Tax=Candidatus Magasanikbacteria bacterium RIFOXYC2_FULL_42_28 TaxID=1798704 RepID=A0A1F6NWG4_9BACT|nr:MAG: hypothetical protein A3J93_01970 [Candidatus Magasanikbacteria bacterium RIFOXYC2_FULL_42_28]
MKEELKKQFLDKARTHVNHVREKITGDIARRETKGTVMKKTAQALHPGDAIAQYTIAAHNDVQIENLKQLYPSPYFTRCEFKINDETKTMYFGKFSFNDEKIYSWVTPAAALRFENPGTASYTRPDGSIQTGQLLSKDQYMIVDGKLKFLSTESTAVPRELIYQEHFTRQKPGFVLPEVIEQMEKAQDQIVRAPYPGPLVISGPAGSGKTTMALHRVAYLMQSPETTELFSADSILVLVQDVGTRDYFSHLLPELGIRGVEIITFAEWALRVLRLENYQIIIRPGQNEKEKNLYEFAKLTTLKKLPTDLKYNKNIFVLLTEIYQFYFDKIQLALFAKQKHERALDRFDLTILLHYHLKTFGEFTINKEYYEQSIRNTYRKKTKAFPAQYNLMIIDEFQNYLPEQLSLLKTCLNHRLESVVYVGDLAQQTQLGTIKNWGDIGETVETNRLVALQKVYRNTKQILLYIRALRYSVQIPIGIKDGQPVQEYICESAMEEITQIKKIITDASTGTIGILAEDKEYLTEFKKEFADNKRVHCLSRQEAQGVEFEIVCLVGISENYSNADNLPPELAVEIKKVERDLLYVALTRAMNELHVMGKIKLKNINN